MGKLSNDPRFRNRFAGLSDDDYSTQDGPHCTHCGSTDPEDLDGDQGYSACCNEPVVS